MVELIETCESDDMIKTKKIKPDRLVITTSAYRIAASAINWSNDSHMHQWDEVMTWHKTAEKHLPRRLMTKFTDA